jgi:DNA-binding protein HU-beta
LNNQELIATFATMTGRSKAAAQTDITTLTKVIMSAIAQGQEVRIPGFGVFECRARAARKGKNPQTGQEMLIPAKKVPVFRAAGAFKTEVEGI